MKDCSLMDLSLSAFSQKACKKAVTIMVHTAQCAGSLETLEGQMEYEAGDAIATGSKGERWPIKRADFLRMYIPCPSAQDTTTVNCVAQGRHYIKKSVTVYVLKMQEPFYVHKDRGTLTGNAGDWLVQYAPGDLAVVASNIFPLYYVVSGDGS
jgi:hypothetical protein